MEPFKADRADDVARHVIDHGCNMTVQTIAGHTLSVFEEHSKADKHTIVTLFCEKHPGPYKVYSAKKS